MIYEVINPSDPITLESDDELVACITTLLLGEGAYPLESEDGRDVLPMFLFKNADAQLDAWLKEHGITNLGDYLIKNHKKISECLYSVVVCKVRDRKALIAAFGNDREKWKKFNEERHGSLNDISGYAFALAKRYEKPPKRKPKKKAEEASEQAD